MGGGNGHASSRGGRRRTFVAAAAIVAAGVPGVAAADAHASADESAFFMCTARTADTALEPYTVPDGVTRLAVLAAGGSGGDESEILGSDGRGGRGALVSATVPVTAGETLRVRAGCDANGRSGGPGLGQGGNGGRGFSSGGGGGGGSGVLRILGFLNTDMLVVAGGGGGGGSGGRYEGGDDGGLGGGKNSGNRSATTPDGAAGDNGARDALGSYHSNGGGGGGGGFRGGRGGDNSDSLFDAANGGNGGSSGVTPQAAPGFQSVAGGAPRGPGFVVIVPLTAGQSEPTFRTFRCINDPNIYDHFTVPAGMSQMFAVVKGAGGADGNSGTQVSVRGGRGAIVQGVLPVAAGQQYRVKAGCKGTETRGGHGYGRGGAPGGTDVGDGHAGGGGGGSALLTLNWAQRAVAGGGGGAGDNSLFRSNGGVGGDGGLTGEDGGGSGGGDGGGRSVVHGGGGGGCPVGGGAGVPGGGGGGGWFGGSGGQANCTGGDGGGGGGGGSLQPADGSTTVLQSGPRSNGLVVIALTS